jgi:hypothetical protein
MSPRKAVAAKSPERRAAPARAAAKPAPAPAPAPKIVADGAASAQATALAAAIERGLHDGKPDTLTPEAFQALMAALCKSYGAQTESGNAFLPLADRQSASPTDIMTMTSALLKAANLAVFELGMWQSWTGR